MYHYDAVVCDEPPETTFIQYANLSVLYYCYNTQLTGKKNISVMVYEI